jgi:hypothetical protein
MPEIEITPEQEERLRALQEDIARDVVGKYGHVRPSDAVEYLLDRYAADDETPEAHAPEAETADGDGDGEADAAGDATGGDGEAMDGTADGGGNDAMLNEMMSLLDTHSDKWGESSGDERYAVDLPDGSTEQVRTKDDVKALLFKHYR